MSVAVPSSVVIFGHGPAAASLALRRVLRFKECKGPLVVLDFTGRGAAALCEDNAMNLFKRPVLWCDLADRQKPVALFQLRRSDHFRQMMLGVLWSLRAVSGAAVGDSTLTWAAEAAWQLSKDGAVGLRALLKTLASPATRRWFLDTQADPADLGRLLQALAWALRFPSIYSLSEGNNRLSLRDALRSPQTVWVEMRVEHFEPCEHQLCVAMVDAAVGDALRSTSGNNHALMALETPTVLHFFPASVRPDGFSAWIEPTSRQVRHVAVFRMEGRRPLSRNALAWAKGADQRWIMGGWKELDPAAHAEWLSNEEIKLLAHADPDSLLIKGNGNGRMLSVRVGRQEFQLSEAHLLRFHSAKLRKITPVRQMSTAAGSLSGLERPNEGLYQRLCNRELLRWGWSRIQRVNKLSHGVDNVTVEMFKENIETELDKLTDELGSRTYRCRPLRRIFIPKADGGQRPLGIACVRDRVVQSAALILLEPLFEPSFSHFSFAFRPRRNAHQALALARSFITSGRSWAVIADIRKCFDNLDHDVLIGLISQKVGDEPILDLIHHWLTVDVLDFCDLVPTDVGVPQGESLSPLFANVYLDPFDKHFERMGSNFVRYADDIIILTDSEEQAQKALANMADFMHHPLRLELKPAKTNHVTIKDGFDFLGFRLDLVGVEIQQPKLEKVVETLRAHLKVLGDQASTLDLRVNALMKLNGVIRGFRNYFLLPGEARIAEQMVRLDGKVEQMAHYYLPIKIRDDPAWICRERFTLARGEEESDQRAKEQLNTLVGGYDGQPNANTPPPGWMTKGENGGNGKGPKRNSKPTLVVEDGEEGDSADETGRLKRTVVEHGERLYVLTHGSYLTLDGEDLVVRRRRAEVHRRPLAELGLVFLQGIAMNISVSLQLKLAALDIPVVFAPPVSEPMAVLNPVRTEKSHLRGLQVLRRDDPDIIEAGLDMLSAKVGNQAAVLRYFAKYRVKSNPELGRTLLDTAEELRKAAGSIKTLDPCGAEVRPVAMGYEGHAAALYWRKLSLLVPASLEFEGRVTRNASDAVNQCVNYVYGMLYGEVWRAVVKHGLDPYFGFVHGSKRNQGSLVFDMIEELRAPFADRFVFGMLGRGFKPQIGEHGHLRTASKRQLAKGFAKRWVAPISWRSRMIPPSEILEHQTATLVKLINREKEYRPYRMRW